MDYPLLFDVYRPKDTCKKDEFQTKTELAENNLKTIGDAHALERKGNIFELVKWQGRTKKAGYSVQEIASKLAT